MIKIFKFMKTTNKNIKNMEYQKPKTKIKPKMILDKNNKQLGYIWYKIKDNEMYIEMLEIINKEKGIGTKLINFLFDDFNIDKIRGEALYESSLRSYYFWESLGAEFEWNPLEIKYENIPFVLNKKTT